MVDERGLLIATLSAALAVAACSPKPANAPAPRTVEVGALTVKAREVPVVYEFVGQTESSQQVEIRARVDGFLEKRVYTEGSLVKSGQVLFLIDRKPFETNLASAQAELSQQQARLTTARANLVRVKPLVADDALAKKDLDDATGQEAAAAAAVEAARAKVASAQLNLGYATISSPVAGLSSFAKVQEGAYVNGQNSLLTYVARLDPMRVNFSLSENESLRVKSEIAKGQLRPSPGNDYTVDIVLADGSTYPAPGRITFADAAFSEATGTFLVRADLPNPRGELRPGQFVRVKVHGFTRPSAIVLPQAAIQEGPRGTFVWVVDAQNKAAQRAVGAGEWLADYWIVNSGLKDGERVIVSGLMQLAPGVPLAAKEVPPPTLPQLTPRSAAAAASRSNAGIESALSSMGGGRSAAAGRSVYFAHGKAQLDGAARAQVQRFAAELMAQPTQRAELSGHVDGSGSGGTNVRLAKARAQAVRDALVAAGVPAERVLLKPPADIVGGNVAEQARRVDISLTGAQ